MGPVRLGSNLSGEGPEIGDESVQDVSAFQGRGCQGQKQGEVLADELPGINRSGIRPRGAQERGDDVGEGVPGVRCHSEGFRVE